MIKLYSFSYYYHHNYYTYFIIRCFEFDNDQSTLYKSNFIYSKMHDGVILYVKYDILDDLNHIIFSFYKLSFSTLSY